MTIRSLKHVAIVGGGAISEEYCKILVALEVNFTVIARSKKIENVRCEVADIRDIDLQSLRAFDGFVICVQAEFNLEILTYLLRSTEAPIFIEKPLSLGFTDHIPIQKFFHRIFIALNRRKFGSVVAAKNLIANKHPIKVLVEITELAERIKGSRIERAAWPLMNTIHVIDLALFLSDAYRLSSDIVTSSRDTGLVKYILKEHKTLLEIAFVDFGDAVGNWGIEVSSNTEKLILRPLEKLAVQRRGEFARREISVPEDAFKPGFQSNIEDFLALKRSSFISYEEYCFLMRTIDEIVNDKGQ